MYISSIFLLVKSPFSYTYCVLISVEPGFMIYSGYDHTPGSCMQHSLQQIMKIVCKLFSTFRGTQLVMDAIHYSIKTYTNKGCE